MSDDGYFPAVSNNETWVIEYDKLRENVLADAHDR